MAELLPHGPSPTVWAKVDQMAKQYKRMMAKYPGAKERLAAGGVRESRINLLDRLAECSDEQLTYLAEKYATFKAFEEAYERGEEFSVTAQEAYRANWMAHIKETRPEVKKALEEAMDRLQPMICPGPCPEWEEFTATLPGYREYWAMFAIDATDSMLKRVGAAEQELARGYTRDRGQVQPPDTGPPPAVEG
jgi:hypothetical protein